MNHQQAARNYNQGPRRSRSDVQSWRPPARPSSALTNSSPSPSPTSTGRRSGEDEIFDSGNAKSPLHDRLLFLAMCLVGQYVDVQVKDGSIYSGIFHTADIEKDFGVVLKMARLTKDGSGKIDPEKEARKAPIRTLIIHAKDFVQIIAKDVVLSSEHLANGRATKDNKHELITDSLISQKQLRPAERVLTPWIADSDAPKGLGLESTFDNSHNRNWDQFKNVPTTYREDLYTTKLGPQSRETEIMASRIAREIEAGQTTNPHLAEERGIYHPEFDQIDEETRYSSVLGQMNDDGAEYEEDGKEADHYNDETFGGLGGGRGSTGSESSINSLTNVEAFAQEPAPTGKKSPSIPPPAPPTPAADPAPTSRDMAPPPPQDGLKRGPKPREDVKKDVRSVKESDPPSESAPTATSGIAAPPASALPIPAAVLSSTSVLARNASGEAEAPTPIKPATTPASTSTATKKPKEFKFNPHAPVFTPASYSARPASPVYGVVPQFQMAQPVGPQLHTSMATTVSAAPFIQPSTASYAISPQAPGLKPQGNFQVYNPQNQQMRFAPPTPGYPHHSGPVYPLVYPQHSLVYMYPQGMIQGQPVVPPPLPQTPPPPPPPPAQGPSIPHQAPKRGSDGQ